MTTNPVYVAIEGGGTKFIVSFGSSIQHSSQLTVSTSSPQQTGAEVLAFIRDQAKSSTITSIGVASFGPIGIDPAKADYGIIGNTPKPGWAGFSYPELLQEFGAPLAVDSDVNGAALAEVHNGSAKGKRRVAYVTVGTGIGAGFVIDGMVSNGRGHPELGHMLIPIHSQDLSNAGYCPIHGGCLEGLAAGPAIKARWGQDLSQLDSQHLGHRLEAYYLGVMCTNLILQFVPDIIVIGGGVIQTPGLLSRIREETAKTLNGYLAEYQEPGALDKLIVEPGCGPISGLVGAYELAKGCALK